MARQGKGRGKPRQLRIIGGQWRGRKLAFQPGPGLRPTTDRIRETLFNWLAPHIHGACCADLFAGSGALGLEALSRGAARCDFVDTSARAVAKIRQHLESLDAVDRGVCHCIDAGRFLADTEQVFDVVFIDAPFDTALADAACQALAQRPLLRSGALVYLETAATDPPVTLPAGWQEHRGKTGGGVSYRLLQVA